MPKYIVLFTVSGWARGIVEANSEEEARAKVDNREWDETKDDLAYDLEEIEEVSDDD
jgi:hypothetical protein